MASPSITIDISDPKVAEMFADCEPGYQKQLLVTVTDKTDTEVTATVDEVIESEETEETEEPEEPDDSLPGKPARRTDGGKPIPLLTISLAGGKAK